ncbi:hypothetical protein CYMTET_23210 [Cymbomonas tetramitiformis]|uniref:CCHC-type domain-containing protein n=1 Tax=Cymbomonas tetramitiformis TaxID=36881 RepID=A0AAE0L1C2_9CHLO|nr:hypothetical protein CYMTET_23210 [Cymbomonas tetramitiformis]
MSTKSRETRTCHSCGLSGHLTRDCPETICGYCGKKGHISRRCTHGGSESEQFLLCTAARGGRGPCECFVRRFIVPLHCAHPHFQVGAPAETGRMDVGCRCVTAALFRSQSFRYNTDLRLCLMVLPGHPLPHALASTLIRTSAT